MGLFGYLALALGASIVNGIQENRETKKELKYAELCTKHKISRIDMPKGYRYYKNKNAKEVENLFRSYGFTDIKLVSSFKTSLLRSGDVKYVSIGGCMHFDAKQKFFSYERVVIYYYN